MTFKNKETFQAFERSMLMLPSRKKYRPIIPFKEDHNLKIHFDGTERPFAKFIQDCQQPNSENFIYLTFAKIENEPHLLSKGYKLVYNN